MKLLLLLVTAIAGIAGSPMEPKHAPKDTQAKAEVVEEEGADREGKLFSVFQIVKFNNDACEAVDGNTGTCYTAAECSNLGGQARGNCASGFGVCCVAVLDPNCQQNTVQLNNSYIVNPGYPNDLDTSAACSVTVTGRQAVPRIFFPTAAPTTTTTTTLAPGTVPTDGYMYIIKKASSSVVQMRLDFLDFDIAGPEKGDCTNETLIITGADASTMKILPSPLCGMLTGQHIYLSVKDVEEVKLTIKLTGARTQSWNILVRQFEDSQTEYLAPRGCLQYFRQDAGSFSTFNYNKAGNSELLNNHMYSVCLSDDDLYCDVALQSDDFDLAGSSGMCSDKVAFGTNIYCGSTFGTAGSVLWNYTGSYVIPLFTDADNTLMNGGYEISFVKLPC